VTAASLFNSLLVAASLKERGKEILERGKGVREIGY